MLEPYTHNPNFLPVVDVIPHRFPRLQLDGVTGLEPGESIDGFWSPGARWFTGHFDDFEKIGSELYVLEGAHTGEALGQLGCYAAMFNNPGQMGVLLKGYDIKCGPGIVVPGDILDLHVDIEEPDKKNGKIFRGMGRASVDGLLVCQTVIEARVTSKGAIRKIYETALKQRG